MERLKDEYLQTIEKVVPLFGKNILEIGCGNGSRSVEIAKKCSHLTAMEPDADLLELAKSHNASQNIAYVLGKAEKLGFPNMNFDTVLFTLSFHHVPIEKMTTAIDEAVRVTKKGGNITFLEPAEEGTFFDAEILFDACDGDERQEKKTAYNTLKHHSSYEEVAELPDETIFRFDSIGDFIKVMTPKKNVEAMEKFLKENNYTLRASRRISIFKV